MVFFQGHQVFPGGLFLDVLLSLWPFVFLFLRRAHRLPKVGKGMFILDFLLIYLFVLIIPNSSYAFLEIKHLLLVDHVADIPNLASWLVFGGVSLIGLALTLIGNFLIVDHYAKNKKEIFWYYLFLSLIAGFGASVGLLDFSSYMGMLPTVLQQIFQSFLGNFPLIILALVTSLLIFLVGFTTHRFLFYKPSA